MDAVTGEEAEKQPPFRLLNLYHVAPRSSSHPWSLARKSVYTRLILYAAFY